MEDIPDRLSSCECALEAHRGYLKALEYGLRVMIISHPNPDQLSRAWRKLLPNILGTHADLAKPVFMAGFTQAIALLTEQIGDA
ncbi:hypothetical protein ABW41_16145 [Stenotrophomonas maltophilia]|nr:hypothetical protein ABW41_16145 [Stenotrophomonas maltophilia]